MKKENNFPNLDWVVVSKDTVVDNQTNSLSIINIIEELTLTGERPKTDFKIPVQIKAIIMWRKNSPEKADSKIMFGMSFIDPNKKTLSRADFVLKFEKNKKRVRSIVNIPDFQVTSEGIYTLEITGDGKVLGNAYIEVIFK